MVPLGVLITGLKRDFRSPRRRTAAIAT